MKIDVLSVNEYEATCRIVGWDQFGKNLKEVEERHLQALGFGSSDSEKDLSPEETAEIEQGNAELEEAAQALMQKSLDLIKEQLVDSPMELEQAQSLIEAMQKNMAEDMDDDEDDLADKDEEDPDLYVVSRGLVAVWSDKSVERVEQFLQSWPSMREKVLAAAFSYYEAIYEDAWLVWGGREEDRIVLPKPTEAKAIEDLFCFRSFHLFEDEDEIGLSGHCTWDGEHGVGVRIKAGEVVEFGHASDGFS